MSAICYIWAINQADVAQLDRAFGYEPKGSRFESWHPQKGRRFTASETPFLFLYKAPSNNKSHLYKTGDKLEPP